MQKERRGFTLIELLAVIVILAIIALIAVPVIMNVIGNARKSAFEDSAYGIVKAGEMYYTNELLENGGMTSDKEFTITNGAFVGEALEVSGSLPKSGKITVTKEGKVAVALSNGEYYVQKTTSESEIKAHSLKEDNITEAELDYKKLANTVFTKATGSTSIPTCITNNTECTAGTKVGVKVNDKDAPLDFYVMSEDASKGTITLIMNENLGGTVAWSSKDDYLSAGGTEADWGSIGNNNKGPITALNYLESQTSSWTNIPLETYTLTDDNSTPLYPTMTRTARARMITPTEANTLLSLSNSSWVYENLSFAGTKGYWTSSTYASSSNFVWNVFVDGEIHYTGITNGNDCGVRPVITISKTIL